METIDRNKAATLIRQSNGKLVGVTFVKRSDRRKMSTTPWDRLPRRSMVGRLASTVTVGKTGAGAPYEFADHDLIPLLEFVTDPNTPRDARGRFNGKGSVGHQYRNVPLEGIEEIRVGGRRYRVQ